MQITVFFTCGIITHLLQSVHGALPILPTHLRKTCLRLDFFTGMNVALWTMGSGTIEFFLSVFHELHEFSGKIFVITVKRFEPATSCVRD